MNLQTYFKDAVVNKASHLYLIGNEMPMIRVDGELKILETTPLLSKDLLQAISANLLSKEQKDKFLTGKNLRFNHRQVGIDFKIDLSWQDKKTVFFSAVISTKRSKKGEK